MYLKQNKNLEKKQREALEFVTTKIMNSYKKREKINALFYFHPTTLNLDLSTFNIMNFFKMCEENFVRCKTLDCVNILFKVRLLAELHQL